jgi:hypothetical protein
MCLDRKTSQAEKEWGEEGRILFFLVLGPAFDAFGIGPAQRAAGDKNDEKIIFTPCKAGPKPTKHCYRKGHKREI